VCFGVVNVFATLCPELELHTQLKLRAIRAMPEQIPSFMKDKKERDDVVKLV